MGQTEPQAQRLGDGELEVPAVFPGEHNGTSGFEENQRTKSKAIVPVWKLTWIWIFPSISHELHVDIQFRVRLRFCLDTAVI